MRAAAIVCILAVAFSIVRFNDAAPAEDSAKSKPIDVAEVRQKIAALAEPDETVPPEERASNWLFVRCEQVVPQLIVALDDRNPKVAEQCLDFLWRVKPRKDMTDALVVKAGDQNSPLRYKALRKLEQSADDPRVVLLLDRASIQDKIFPDPVIRARWSWLGGHPDRAVNILKPLVQQLRFGEDHKPLEPIRLLGEIGGPASIELLKPFAAGNRWPLAAEAYQALAKIDPKNHGLTQDQAALLKGWKNFKETGENYRQRMLELAKLNAQELRPLVMQMLRSTHGVSKSGPGYEQRVALLILAAWKDKESLPQIREIMQAKRSPFRCEAVAAYLAIDDGPAAQQTVLNSPEYDVVLRGIVAAPIPAERKVAILRAAQAALNIPYAVPHALRHEWHHDKDGELLISLMDQETSLVTLAGYCELAAADKQRRFADQVRRAMTMLARNPARVTDVDNTFRKDLPSAAVTILRAVATYDLKELAPDVRKFMDSENPTIRAAAQATGARLRVPGAIESLHAQLGAANAERRKQAAHSLLSIPAIDETERAAREEAVLAHLGKPSEDDVLRVLVTCGGERSVEALRTMINDADVRRAVYAGWILAQLSDEAAARIGLCRVAICGMFHHEIYQSGAGIDFELTPKLKFHQVTMRLNRDPRAEAAPKPPVSIPVDLLKIFDWDEEEQAYAIRCYRLAEQIGNGHGLSVHFLDDGMMGLPNRRGLNATHLPLLKEIVTHDSRVKCLMVQGQAVAHFPYRQRAAQAIAAITQEQAAYVGLGGESIEANAFPTPYQNQDRLLARFFVDRVQQAQLPDNPKGERQWNAFELHRNTAHQWKEKFGPQVLDAIREEAQQRKVDMKRILQPEGS